MKFESTEVFGFRNAIIGMRLPMSKDYEDALSKTDSYYEGFDFVIGPNDKKVMKSLINADIRAGKSKPNSKFLRMIHVQVAITAPLSFWKEYDTYKVSTVANSTSTMHKIQSYEITEDCFERKPNGEISKYINVEELENIRKDFNETKDKDKWYDIIYGLNDSWLQTRMCDLNYSTLQDMVHWRKNHKQNCWSGKDNPEMENFIKWAKTLPYADLLIFGEEDSEESEVLKLVNKVKSDISGADEYLTCNHTNYYHILKDTIILIKNDFEKLFNAIVEKKML